MIIEFNKENFDSVLQQTDKPLVVEFYSPECVHCRKTERGIDELSEELGNTVTFAKCNILEQEYLTSLYDITNLPTLLFIKNGEIKNKGLSHKRKKRRAAVLTFLHKRK